MSTDHAQGPSETADVARPAAPPTPSGGRRGAAWRVGTPAALLLSGALIAVSAVNSHGTDLRPGRYTDLATLVRNDKADLTRLQRQAADLTDEVNQLREGVGGREARRLQRQADRLRGPAGLEPVSGPGVSVVMSDAPSSTLEAALADPTSNLNRYVVHQQDIQAVVNALWAGGATAVTIQGQRVVTTTGIKCEGNAVQLQGVPYAQPYHIQAVGDPTALTAALDQDADVGAFRTDAANAAIGLGWTLTPEGQVDAPAFDGLLGIDSATPVS